MTKKCICQICSCGRHRCPHGPSNPNRVINKADQGNCHVSEYQKRYHKLQPKRGPFHRPTDLLQSEGPLLDDTTQRADFVPHEVSPRKQKEQEKYVPNPHRFETVSEHRDNYQRFRGAPAKIPPYLRGETMRVSSTKPEYKTTSHEDFRGCKAERTERIVRGSTYSAPSEPFNETSLHRQDYLRFNQPPRPTARQPDKILIEGQRSTVTNYSSHFQPKKIPPKLESKKEEHVPPSEPFTDTSIFRADFVNHRGAPKARMYRPISDLFKSGQPMQSETTKALDFKEWQVSPLKAKEPEQYRKPEGNMDCRTTQKDYGHFGSKGIPAKNARPRTKLRFGREDLLDDTTNYGASFQWKAQRVVHSKGPAVHNEIFPAPAPGSATDKSEFLDSYRRFQVVPPKMFRDSSTLFKSSDRVASSSVYDGEYKWPTVKCPSDALLRGSHNFVFDHETENGHKVFSMPEVSKSADMALA